MPASGHTWRVRLLPRSFHLETFVCGWRGHHTPAAHVGQLGDGDESLGLETPTGRRFARCLRCDSWHEVHPAPPESPRWPALPPVADLDKPRRGRELKDAVIMRVIAISRGLHSLFFGLAAVVLASIELHLGGLRSEAQRIQDALHLLGGTQGQIESRDQASNLVQRVLNLEPHAVKVLLVTAIVYSVLEGVEAVGLWLEKRWAEYLTVVALAGFLPFEIHELIKRVSVLRVGAFVVNIAILVYLVWKKRLFGIGRNRPEPDATDWEQVLRRPERAAAT